MAEVRAIDFNKIPKQKLSANDVKKMQGIILNTKNGNIEQATKDFDSFARDKQMDKLRTIGLKALTFIGITSTAILTHKNCPKLVKVTGDVIASKGAEIVRKYPKVYNKIAKKFPSLVGNVGEDFASRALESGNAIKKVITKITSNAKAGTEITEALTKRNIKTLGDVIAVGVAAATSIPAGNIVGEVGNMLDEYGDGENVGSKKQAS